MNKISSGVVFVCIFALTHHSGITASASDLSSPAQMAATGGKVASTTNFADTPTTRSSGKEATGALKQTDLFAIENGNAEGGDDSIVPHLIGTDGEGKRRLARSFFYTYPYDGLYSNLYANNGGYYPAYPTYSTYYPSVYKFFGIGFNPYGYPHVIWG